MSNTLQLFIVSILFVAFSSYAEKNPVLPPPYETPSAEHPATVIGWPAGKMPVAPAGFKVSLLTELKYPRALYVLPSGNILVSQAKKSPDDQGDLSPNQITLLKMNGHEMVSSSVFAKDLALPFGMAIHGDRFYVGCAEKVLSFPYANEELTGQGTLVTTLPFPEPKRHWTRDVLMKPDGSKLYVSVGSASNVGEAPDPLDPKTAAILEMNPDGSEQRIFASGVRNPVALAWEPTTQKLWAVVNERDELGDNLPPDYITHIGDGGFYGWPYAYWGPHEDPRHKGKRPDLVAKSIVPDFSVGAHTASLGIAFTTSTAIAAPFNAGALIAQHGSWNRAKFSGYKVLYVPFENGEAVDGEKDFLTGFIADEAQGTVYGRPVATAVLKDGSVIVTDDGAGKIWLITKE